MLFASSSIFIFGPLILLHSERPKLCAILVCLSAIGLSFSSPRHHFWRVCFSECADTNGTECNFSRWHVDKESKKLCPAMLCMYEVSSS